MDLTLEIKLRFQISPAWCLQCGLGINVTFASSIVLSLFVTNKQELLCFFVYIAPNNPEILQTVSLRTSVKGLANA